MALLCICSNYLDNESDSQSSHPCLFATQNSYNEFKHLSYVDIDTKATHPNFLSKWGSHQDQVNFVPADDLYRPFHRHMNSNFNSVSPKSKASGGNS